MISKVWKTEFRLELFGIEYSRPSHFVLCQWQKKNEVNILYLIYRWLIAGYFFGSFIGSVCEQGSDPNQTSQFMSKWPIYLTNWGVTMYAFQAIIGVFIITKKFVQERKTNYDMPKESKMPRIYQLYWILHSASVVLAFGITISYWIAVYDPAIHRMSAVNIIAHALNSVFMFIDFSLVRHPFRLLHVYWPVAFVSVYLMFTVVYFELGGSDRHFRPFIYPILNWENGVKTTIAAFVGLLFVMFVHFFVWLLFLLRRWLYSEYQKKDQPDKGLYGFTNSVASDTSIHLDVI